MFFVRAPRLIIPTGVRRIETKQGAVTVGGSTTINMPSNRFDTLVVALVAAAEDDPNGAPTIADFTSIASQSGSGRPRMRASYCVNPGPSKTMTINSTTRNAAYILYAYGGANVSEAPAASIAGNGADSATLPNPPSRTSGVDGCEFLIGGCMELTTTTTGWSAPSGYSNLLTQSAGDTLSQNTVLMSASKNLASAGADDPGEFTHGSITGGWVATTIVIKPA